MDTRINKTSLGCSYKAKIRTLTPLHIGNGNIFSPYGDYFIKKDRVHFIDQEILYDRIMNWGKMEEYISEAILSANKSKYDFFENYFRDHSEADILDKITAYSYPAYVKGNPVGLSEFIRSGTTSFIPGSSLKGAIRSAILYSWLCTENGNNNFVQWFTKFDENYNSDKGNVETIRAIERDFTELIEEGCFGKLRSKDTTERLCMSYLKVADTTPFYLDSFAAYELLRYNMISGIDGIPLLKECVDKNMEVDSIISLDFSRKSGSSETYDKRLMGLTTIEKFINVINKYSRAVLDYDYGILQTKRDYKINTGTYSEWLSTIRNRFDEDGNRIAFMRMGYGKMQFHQTIALKVFDHTGKNEKDPKWVNYLEYCERFRKDNVPDVYPATRTLTSVNQMPLGWLSIEFE